MQHLLHILEVCQAPFLDSPPVPSQYADPIVDATAVFPLLSKLLGNANYTTDTKQPKKASDSCWKESYGHPSLFLGIFTIFSSRFETAPSGIIYDDVCKLHQYCL